MTPFQGAIAQGKNAQTPKWDPTYRLDERRCSFGISPNHASNNLNAKE